MPSRIDLHTHTTASDGTVDPLDLFDRAAERSVQVLAVTDHDSTAGYTAIAAQLQRHPDLRVIPGIEMSAEGELSCHLLGYFIDPTNAQFQARLESYRRQRVERSRAMTERLATMGYPVPFERVLALAKGGSVGRPHVADALIEAGFIRSRQEAFDRFLKRDGPAFIPSDQPSAGEVIQVIRQAGGVPVLAHPSYYTSAELLKRLVDSGLMGIEAYYPEHSRGLIQRYLELAKEYNLVATGGSDFHGPRTGRTALAQVAVPDEVVIALENARNRV